MFTSHDVHCAFHTSLGDSGFCIIRSSIVIHEQKPQIHFFNCPRYVRGYSLTDHPVLHKDHRQLAKISNKQYRGRINDNPRHADKLETKLRDGDIVILYVRHMITLPMTELNRLQTD